MINITQWTRKAQQERTIKTLDNGDTQLFCVSITHDRGQYRAHWEMATDQRRDGYKSRLTTPFADYNGQTVLKEGRFSRAQLERADKQLAENLEKYFSIWQACDYQGLCNEIHADFNK